MISMIISSISPEVIVDKERHHMDAAIDHLSIEIPYGSSQGFTKSTNKSLSIALFYSWWKRRGLLDKWIQINYSNDKSGQDSKFRDRNDLIHNMYDFCFSI